MPRRVPQLALVAFSATALGLIPAAWAAGEGRDGAVTGDAAIATALFEEGRKLVDAGQFAEACPKFAESQRLAPAGGTLLNLARCHEKLGRRALAYSEYEAAIATATRDGRADRVAFAKKAMADIEPTLGRLAVVVPSADSAAPGLAVSVDGTALPREALGVSVRVDAGLHVVEARADKKREFRGEITVAAKERREVTVSLSPPVEEPPKVDPPKVEPPKVEPPKVEPPKVEPPKVEPPKVEPPKVEPPRDLRPRTEIRREGHPLALPLILGGATGLVVGLGAGGYAVNKLLNPPIGSACFTDASVCGEDASRRNAGRKAIWVSGISVGVGTILLVTGVALPSREVIVKTGTIRVTPRLDVGPTQAAVTLGGTF